jgi:hypothetical protein
MLANGHSELDVFALWSGPSNAGQPKRQATKLNPFNGQESEVERPFLVYLRVSN